MSSKGLNVFRSAVLIEATANLASIIPLLLAPETCLSYIVKSPAYITPVTSSLAQWIGAIFVVATVPLVLSYPEPRSNEPPSLITGRRRTAYLSLGMSEVALAALTSAQFVRGNSGLRDGFLFSATGTFAALVGMRAYFLYVKPEYMEATARSMKAE